MREILGQRGKIETEDKGAEANVEDREAKKFNPEMTRRGFLKLGLLSAATGVVAEMAPEEALASASGFLKKLFERKGGNDIRLLREIKEVEDKFWLDVIENISREKGEKITPNDVRSYLMTKFLDIPQGWTSALTTKKIIESDGSVRYERVNPEWDRLMETYFVNRSVIIGKNERGEPIVRSDFREFPDMDIALKKLKKYIENHPDKTLEAETYYVLQKEYDFYQKIKDNPNIEKFPIEFDYLPNGVPVFSVGVRHDNKKFSEDYLQHYLDTYKVSKYVALEGFSDLSAGASLYEHENRSKKQRDIFDNLLHKLIDTNFDGYFLELDPRNISKILFSNYIDKQGIWHKIKLPEVYYKQYFKYLEENDSNFAERIGSAKKLELLLQKQLDTKPLMKDSKNRKFIPNVSVDDNLKLSSLPTGEELGQDVFANAMIALKLHILAQNMGEGKIKKGIISNFIGAGHINMIGFYIKYPQEAVKIILRTLNEVLADRYGEKLSFNEIIQGKNRKKNIELAMDSLGEPDWQKIIGEIGRVSVAHVEEGHLKPDNILKWKNIFKGLDIDIARALIDDKYIQQQIDDINKRASKK